MTQQEENIKAMEEWRPIEGFEGVYEISSHGNVKSCRRKICIGKNCMAQWQLEDRVMQTFLHVRGYRVVFLRLPGKRRKFFVHVLVARAFIPNPEGKLVVNHIDCDKENNCVWNLEWLTHSENTSYWHRQRERIALENAQF